MGLSSSQGRLLLLTSRISDIELSQMLITQRQQQLAIDRENIAKEYTEAMSNHKIVIKVKNDDDSGTYTREDITYDNLSSAGYLLTNADGQIYLRKNAETGEWDYPKDYISLVSVKDEEGNDLTDENGNVKYQAVIKGMEDYPMDIIDGTELLSKSSAISNSIVNGALYVINANKGYTGISMENLNSNTSMEYVLDTSDDAQAQSKYEYELSKISRQDNMLDMQMKQLDTQHEALLKEYDSIKKLISNNIDRTFDLFNNG